jgi:UDP-glucose 4-epimerase
MIEMNKVLVTGGAGFIGSHLVEFLIAQGCNVVVLDNFLHGNKLPAKSGATVVYGDVTDSDLVIELSRGCDLIFHFAAYLGVDFVADNPLMAMEVEAAGIKSVALAARLNNIPKIVYASTSGVYGEVVMGETLKEDFTVSPRSSYAVAKRFCEIYLKSFYKQYGIDSIAIRYFNVYGPRQDTRMVISRFMEHKKNGSPITVYGTGEQTRDFTYVKDAVNATYLLATKVSGCEIVNVATGVETNICTLAKTISSNIDYVDVPASRYDFEVQTRKGNAAKLHRLVGPLVFTTLEEGLQLV